jgi:hypothetical protein
MITADEKMGLVVDFSGDPRYHKHDIPQLDSYKEEILVSILNTFQHPHVLLPSHKQSAQNSTLPLLLH